MTISTEIEAGANGTLYTANYGYFDYQVTDSFKLRAGKVRLILVTPTIVSETDTGRTPEIIHSGTEAAGANPEPPMETLTR